MLAGGGMDMHRGTNACHEILDGVSDLCLQVVVWIYIERLVHGTKFWTVGYMPASVEHKGKLFNPSQV